ncbi:MAG: hypothetical protein ABI488_07105 [Polyangiaceae bacterium]
MLRSGFGVWGRRGACGALLLSFATVAAAQSTASFPVAPVSSAPAAPVVNAPPSAGAPPPPPGAPLPPASAPSTDATTDSRYPLVAGPARTPSITRSGVEFYPALLPYREGLPVPPGYRVEHRSANGLIAAGLASFLTAYGAALVVGAGDSFSGGSGWLVLPVLGPWAAIGARSYHCDNDPTHANKCISGAFNQVQTIAILSGDAVVQATGAVLFLAGLGSARDELVRNDLQAGVRVTPRVVGTSGFGLGFDGRF